MSLGRGKYDLHLKQLIQKFKAAGGLLVIFNGTRGTGISFKVALPVGASVDALVEATRQQAWMLREVADLMEADAARMLAEGPRAVDRARDSGSDDN